MTSHLCTRCRLRLIALLAIIWAGISSISGCATLDQIIQKPTVAFTSMNVTDADLLQGTAVFNFKITNPNPISIRANRVTYDLKLNGRHFVAGQLSQGVTLAASGSSPLTVPVTMRYLDFFESLAKLWQAKGAEYALTGGFDVGPFTIPFQAHGRLDLPAMPKISLGAIAVEKITLSGAILQCRLKVENPNAFTLDFKRLEYNLKLGGRQFVQAAALPQNPISGKQVTMLNLGYKVSFAELGRSAHLLLQGSNADYTLNGGMVIDSAGSKEQMIPIHLSGKVPIER